MFPVLLLLARVPETPLYSEYDICEAFLPELAHFGEAIYKSSMIMSCGPFGATMFYRFRINPENATKLAQLIEYASDPHHGYVTTVMRINDGKVGPPAARLSTPLCLDEIGCEWLDDLPPPEVVPLNATDRDEHFDIQLRIKDEYNQLIEKVAKLEADNLILKNRVILLKGDTE